MKPIDKSSQNNFHIHICSTDIYNLWFDFSAIKQFGL